MSTETGPEFTYVTDQPKPLSRVCRKCSVQTATSGDFCPNCGASYVQKSRFSKRTAIIGAVVLALAIGGIGGGLKIQHDREVKAEAAAAAKVEAEKKEAEEEAQRAAANEAAAERAERAERAEYVTSLEENILKDAKEKEDEGILEGPFTEASCTPLGGGSSDDLTALTGDFDCIAINKTNADGTQSGYGYRGTINYNTGTLGWQFGNR